ncbi:MAG: DNA adenine methylase [Anaerolineae bacterium]|nr:DNA adenine methylase [Anaerolineae bacterium]
MSVPQPIPYQGSKRRIARHILRFFPGEFDTLIEPFAGSAAVSLAAAHARKARRFHLNDINQPLMALWREIIHDPAGIADAYEKLWREQTGRERAFYDFVRDRFNATQRPDYFLYLLARCVKASVRYNAQGEFNQSPDNRRKGRQPESMRRDIEAASRLLRGTAALTSRDYGAVLGGASPGDLVYMDPPYQGVSGFKDPRYYSGVDFDRFAGELARLNERGVPFLLSYDGHKAGSRYGRALPAGLNLHKVEIEAGRSSQATLLGRNEITYESLYLSGALVERLGNSLVV